MVCQCPEKNQPPVFFLCTAFVWQPSFFFGPSKTNGGLDRTARGEVHGHFGAERMGDFF